jgi:hypothetical protein
MRMNKAIKRIVALGTGITMVGATILGAMAAADLNKYPTPFIENGAFNALIVVGAKAQSSDVLGSVDIATSLQYANTVTTAVPGATETKSVVGEGAKVEGVNNYLTLNRSLSAVKAQYDEKDLPTLLAKGIFVNDGDDQSTNFEYTQKLEFGTASVNWLRDNDYKDDQNPYVMLYGPKSSAGSYFMKYTLDFTKLPESKWYSTTSCGTANELCDFEGTKVKILGKEYEITKAERDGAKVTWEMMGGMSLNTMNEGDTQTFTVDGKDYEVTIDIIGDSSPATAVLTVNGQSTKELSKDQTDKVAGIELGMKKVIAKSGGGKGLVQFYLGAEKIVLTDDNVAGTLDTNVRLGSTSVDDLYSDFTMATAAGAATQKIQKLTLTWAPQEKVFLAAGESVALPGLGSFKVEYGGLSPDAAKSEKISVKNSGNDKIQLYAPLDQGDLTLPILFAGNTANYTGYGKSTTAGNGIVHIAAGTLAENDYVILSDSTARETHVVQLKSITSANLTKVEDIVSKVTYETTCIAGSATCTINIGNTPLIFDQTSLDSSAGTIAIDASSSKVASKLYTNAGMTIQLAAAGSFPAATHSISFREESSTGTIDAGSTITLVAALASDGKTYVSTVSSPAFVNPDSDHSIGPEFGDTAAYGYMTTYGTLVKHYTEPTQDYVEIYYPDTEAHAQAFITGVSSEVVSGSGSTYDQVQKIEVGAAVLDTEVASLTAQNTIVIGGPCVNTLAAELMGNPADCTAGFEDGKAMIKLFEHADGKVALLVAGYTAMDTRRASRVVANFKDYSNFAGTELEVTGTSLSDIKVGVPTPVVPVVPATQ